MWLGILLYKSSPVELFYNKHLFYAVNLGAFQGLVIDEPVLPFKSKIWLIDDADETSQGDGCDLCRSPSFMVMQKLSSFLWVLEICPVFYEQ